MNPGGNIKGCTSLSGAPCFFICHTPFILPVLSGSLTACCRGKMKLFDLLYVCFPKFPKFVYCFRLKCSGLLCFVFSEHIFVTLIRTNYCFRGYINYDSPHNTFSLSPRVAGRSAVVITFHLQINKLLLIPNLLRDNCLTQTSTYLSPRHFRRRIHEIRYIIFLYLQTT